MKCRFYIERRLDESGNLMLKERPIFMSVSFEGKRLMLGTGLKADFNSWDSDLQRLRLGYPGAYEANTWLDTLSNTANKSWNALKNLPVEPDPDQFRKIFMDLKPRLSTGFFDVFYLFLESGSERWSHSTYQKVRTIYKHLREFEDQTGFKLAFHKVNDQFLESFIDFYRNKGNKASTTYKAVNTIVWFLNWATENGYNVHTGYRRFYKIMGGIPEVAQIHLVLNWDELMKLRNYQTRHLRSERVRDLFCFMCFTGIRFSELQRLKKDDVRKEEVLVRGKNGRVRKLPFNRYAREIHDKYENKYYLNNTAFPPISLITMNKYLRLVGQESGLDRMVVSSHAGGEKVPLFQRLTAGIAVHTFIASALELNIPIEVISDFTGVKNDSRIKKIKMDLSEVEIKKFNQL